MVKFHINYKIGLFKLRFFKIFFSLGAGRVKIVCDSWKSLPENLKIRQGTTFEYKLSQMANRGLKLFTNELRSNYTTGTFAKQKVGSVIYDVCMDNNRKMFRELRHQAAAYKLIRMCKFTTLLFQHMNE